MTRRARILLILLLALVPSCALLAAASGPTLVFSPPEWSFGMILQGEKVHLAVKVTSSADVPVTVTFVPTCTCLTVQPSAQWIAPGGTETFDLSYDSIDDTGITTRGFIVHTGQKGAPALYYTMRGAVRAERETPGAAAGAHDTWVRRPAGGSGFADVTLFYYYTPGCRSCEEFLGTEIPRMERELGIRIDIQRKDLLDAAVYQELSRFASEVGQDVHAAPALRAGGTLLQGDPEIRQRLAGTLRAALAAARPDTSPAGGPAAGAIASPSSIPDRLSILPVVAAGLIDGINPCAFTTLIFLLASLALGGRGRREVLLIGALFSLAVFLTYFAIGLGFFAALRVASTVSVVSVILRWALVAALLVFAGLSVYDYTLIRAGRPTEMLLQLPSALKKRIHASIRTHVRTATIAASALVLGFFVSIFEFACTGQVYLPLLGYLVRVHRQGYAVGLLLLYNLCFIVPLLAVFGASFFGVSSGGVTRFFQTHMGKVKLALAAVFIGLAVFTLVG
jgi:cytochrome c biogenesis protein CcdA